MAHWQLAWAGLWRKPVRTALVALQIALAFALFGLLQGLLTAVHDAIVHMRPDVLIVRRATDGGPLPIAMYGPLRGIDGVVGVTYLAGFPATFEQPDQHVFAIATEIRQWVAVVPGFSVSEDAIDALARSRTGALVSRALANRYDWKTGDRIPLQSERWPREDGSIGWAFDIVGIFEMDPHSISDEFLIINYGFLDASRRDGKDTVRSYLARVASPAAAPMIGESIDRHFANSGNETQTESMRDEGERVLRTIGDVAFLVRAVLGAVFFSLLFSVGSLIVQSIRERRSELAILKTIGFDDLRIYKLLLFEIVVLCTAPALIGLFAASALMPFTGAYTQVEFAFPPRVFAIGVALAVLIALITVTPPAIRAAKTPIAGAIDRA